MFVAGYTNSPAFGGPGGTAGSAQCDGSLVGFDVRVGTTMLRVSARCQKLDGSIYNVSQDQGTVGIPVPLYCPAGYVGVGIVGRSGAALDGVSLVCGRITNVADTLTTGYAGGLGGTVFSYTCPYPSYVIGINYRVSSWLDNIQLMCKGKLSVIVHSI